MNRSFSRLSLLAALASLAHTQDRPNVLSLEPPHLATGVDAFKVKQLVVKFDQDMDPSVYSLCGGGPSFPKVTRTSWRDARTFVVDVELGWSTVYVADLACPGSAGFRTKEGGTLSPTPWQFATRGDALPQGDGALAAERLFAAIRDQYSYRDRLGIDWNDLHGRFHEQMVAAADGPSLALLVSGVLATAQDPHISVRWGEATLPTWRRPVVANFDLRGVQKVFPKLQRIGKSALLGRSEDGIGYLFVPTFAREQRDDFERVLESLRGLLDCKGIVLDVRTNGGGDEMLARRLAAFFVSGDKVYAGHRVRDPKAPDGFRDVEQRSVRGNPEPDVYGKQVAVLMGPLNMSSCEAFLLMMKQAPQAILVGVNSFGSSGNPVQHNLVPGLSVMLPSWQALRPDGTMFEGEGIEPHIHVDSTPEQLAGEDPVLAEALLRLRGQR
ncbi:MAG: hypothetical protein JNK15_21400 [Planctomycetes bacterium]|nr:hypothetical protein [Planctomycetota bacterium]